MRKVLKEYARFLGQVIQEEEEEGDVNVWRREKIYGDSQFI